MRYSVGFWTLRGALGPNERWKNILCEKPTRNFFSSNQPPYFERGWGEWYLGEGEGRQIRPEKVQG